MGIKYTFCITTGRADSKYLAKILNHLQDTVSFHKPLPQMIGSYKSKFIGGYDEELWKDAKEKFEMIQQVKSDLHLYVEITNTFIKGFGWYLPYFIKSEEIGVITLKRDYTEILDSHKRVDCLPVTPAGNCWLIYRDQPGIPFSLQQRNYFKYFRSIRLRKVVPRFFFKKIDDYFLHDYCKLTYELGELYLKKFPEVKNITMRVTDKMSMAFKGC